MNKILLLAGLIFLNLTAAKSQNTPIFQMNQHIAGSFEVSISGIENQNIKKSAWNTALVVFVEGSQIPVSGTYSIIDNNLHFSPNYPFEEGVRYHINYFEKDTLFVIPKMERKAAVVNTIYPTTNQIPENLLRFYIYFSSPMRDGNFLDYVHLFDGNGEDLKGVFFDNQYELWNENFTRLTILVDPGRVKTGLQANIKWGRAFQKGERYIFVIDKNWKTISGQTLAENYVKEFYGVTADFTAPDKEQWNITIPKVNTRQPIVIHFGKSIDHISAEKFIRIVGPTQATIVGKTELQENESVLRFYPLEKWKVGQHIILLNSRFEDIVGNNLNGLFDHKLGSLKSEQEGMIATINFEMKN